MQTLEIGSDIDLAGPGTNNGTAVDLVSENHPFKAGATAAVVFGASAWTEAEQDAIALELQGREQDTESWSTLAQMDASEQPLKIETVVLTRYLRWANTSASAADGRGSVQLLGN